MNIQTTDAQAWWIAIADEIRPREGLDAPAAFAAIKNAFNFPIVPTGPAKQGGGMEFVNGALKDGATSIVITKLTVFSDGLSIEVPSNTRNSEIVLQHALGIFASLGVREPITPPLHYFLSQVVADFAVSLDRLFPNSLLQEISEAFPIEAKAQFGGLYIGADKTTIPGRIGPINPTTFNISRRIDIPYERN